MKKVICLVLLAALLLCAASCTTASGSGDRNEFADYYNKEAGLFIYPQAEFAATHTDIEKELNVELQPLYYLYGSGGEAKAEADLENIDSIDRLTVRAGDKTYPVMGYDCELSFVFDYGRMSTATMSHYTEDTDGVYDKWVKLAEEAFGCPPVQDDENSCGWSMGTDDADSYFQITRYPDAGTDLKTGQDYRRVAFSVSGVEK